jgi:release factor glutamine methyltransferase
MKWTIRELIRTTSEYLQKKGIDEPRLTTELLLSHALAMKRVELYLNFDKPLRAHELDTFREFIKRRLANEPVQYIIGNTGFMGIEITTSEGVFIPRQETEVLVSVVKLWLEDRELENFILFDVGTGTGAIAIALARFFRGAKVFASDFSEIALGCARENASAQDLIDRITFLSGDLLQPFAGVGQADAIVSNPPYVPAEEIERLPEIVKREPVEALIGGREGLETIEKLIEASPVHLKAGGLLAFEIGINQAAPVTELLKGNGNFAHIKLVPDLRGIKRVATATLKTGSDPVFHLQNSPSR